MLYANYHTHTFRCGHAGSYTEENYAAKAVSCGMKILGFSDHIPWPYKTGYVDEGVRMKVSEAEEYFDGIRRVGEEYKGVLTVYTGFECEFFEDYLSWLEEMHERADYLILGPHWITSNEYDDTVFQGRVKTPDGLRAYAESCIRAMETGLFRIFAHPDYIFSGYPVFDKTAEAYCREICRAANATGTVLEYNLLGLRKGRIGEWEIKGGLGYPLPLFWKVASEEGCTAIIGCDAHNPMMLGNEADQQYGQEFLDAMGVKVLRELPGLGEKE